MRPPQVVVPRNASEAKGLLLASIREPDPVIFFEPKILYRTSVEDVPDADYQVPLSTADVMREGGHVTVVSDTEPNRYHGRRFREQSPHPIRMARLRWRRVRRNPVGRSVPEQRLTHVSDTSLHWHLCA